MRDQYMEQGFVVLPSFVSHRSVESAVEGIRRLSLGDYQLGTPPHAVVRNERSGQSMVRLDQPQLADPALKALVSDQGLADIASQLMGSSAVQVWYAHALLKPVNHPASHVGWHCDGQYVNFFEGDFVTAWVALSDISDSSGALTYVPKSHKLGLPRLSGFSSATPFEEQTSLVQCQLNDNWRQFKVTGPLGTVAFHHSRLLHGSDKNESPNPRFSLSIHYRGTHNLLRRPVPANFVTSSLAQQDPCPIIGGKIDEFDLP